MAKIDCSTVIGFVQEANRVCKMHEKCGDCPFAEKIKCPMFVFAHDNSGIQEIIECLQKLSDEHSVK